MKGVGGRDRERRKEEGSRATYSSTDSIQGFEFYMCWEDGRLMADHKALLKKANYPSVELTLMKVCLSLLGKMGLWVR
uniref:Uncharacterized protein n=1 Tax=Oryza punctata TaxID=4537 RepID=A0A0E0M9C3_ORYPU